MKISEIVFTPSAEVDEEEIKNIADSIKEVGLSHPVIVRPANGSHEPGCPAIADDESDQVLHDYMECACKWKGKFELVSGEKRIRAFLLLGLEEIPADVREIDETEGRVIRAHENLKRHNLPWWEEAALIEQLHALRQQQHGVGQPGRPAKDTEKAGWGIRDTARELGLAIGPIAEDLQLARAVLFDPSLRNVRDKKTAVRLVRIAARRHSAEEDAGLKAPEGLEVNQTYFGDSASILAHFPSQSVDHAILDPPWINFFEPSLALDERTLPVFRELYRVLKINSFMLTFAGLDDITYYCGYDVRNKEGEIVHIKGEFEKIGWTVAKTPIIWQKLKSLSRRGVRPWEYDRDFEFIIIAVKGAPALTAPTAISSFKAFDAVPVRSLLHPNEKPVELLEALIKDISYEGNIIIDPFAGSFVTADACKKTKRRFVAIERDKKFYDQGRKRLGFKD